MKFKHDKPPWVYREDYNISSVYIEEKTEIGTC